ncbi:CrcB family protein [Microbacterium sp. WCS2018Hpa-9]|uniref:fluoride efflux transporter FluC n=1 Tax=Microbacterium sp. WCS2018Hpa-9 TaxID=3073635 RepID=UPI00288A0575|nr:CrcB family protein [Microbacterium sp. WCS2018Hpa-9]
MTFRSLLLVFAGGGIGTAARLAVGLGMPDAGGLPIGTLAVNVLGSLLIGILAARLPRTTGLRVFLGTGVLGGFTTYSAFMTGAVGLWSAAPLVAFAYAAGSLVLGLAAAAWGLRLGRPRPSAARVGGDS